MASAAPGCPGAEGDPALGPLGANGGATPSLRPGAGGAAIDRVPAAALPGDRPARRPCARAAPPATPGRSSSRRPGRSPAGPGRIGAADADVEATIDTRGLAAEYYVDFGPTTAYGGRTAGVAIPGAASPTGVTARLTGLAAGTVYHYRVVAVGPDGASAGADRTLRDGAGGARGRRALARPARDRGSP